MPALEIQVLVPFKRQPSPSRTAVVDIAATSDPASGSDSANAVIVSPAATPGNSARFCASLPNRLTGALPSPCIASAKSARPDAQASVSRASASARTSTCSRAPPYALGTHARSKPARPSSRTRRATCAYAASSSSPASCSSGCSTCVHQASSSRA